MRETAQKTTTETAYSLLSAALTAVRFNEVARQHRCVENSLDWRLDWRLDAVMNEDQGSTRMGQGPENLAILRPMAINAIEKEGSKGSLRGKFKRASCDEDDLSGLLTLFRNPISLGNRPEDSPHASKASSRRGRKVRRRVFSPPGSHREGTKTFGQWSNLPRIATVTR
jgi:predicted transposase YbfD/YdcC